MKISRDRIRDAVSLGYSLYPESLVHAVSLAAFHNAYFNRRWYWCFSPTLALLLGNGEWGMNAVLNNSLTFEYKDAFFIRPEAGVNPLGLFAGFAWIHLGISTGVTF